MIDKILNIKESKYTKLHSHTYAYKNIQIQLQQSDKKWTK